MMNWVSQNRLIVAIGLFGAAAGGIFLTYFRPAEPPPLEIATIVPTAIVAEVDTPTPAPTHTPAPTATPAPLRVYISGEVVTPDVYFLPRGSIIKDAIEAAGGITAKADVVVVNQAQELQDQQHIHIPAKVEERPTPPIVEGGVEPTSPPPPTAVPARNTDTNPTVLIINLNTASAAELELLPGVGPSIAQRIIEYRTTQALFIVPEDVMNVKGIGPATFEKFKNNITVE